MADQMSLFNQQLKKLAAEPYVPRATTYVGTVSGPMSTAAPSPQRRARAADAERAARRALADKQELDSITSFRKELAASKNARPMAVPMTPWSVLSPIVALVYGALAVIGVLVALAHIYPDLTNPLASLHGGGAAPVWLAWLLLALTALIGIFCFELRSLLSGVGLVAGGAGGAVFVLYAMFQWPDIGAQFLTPEIMAAAEAQKLEGVAGVTPVELYMTTVFNG